MSLLSEAYEDFVLYQTIKQPDGQGGSETVYEEKEIVKVAVTFDTSTQARIANKLGVNSVYTLTTNKNLILNYHDVVKCVRNGKTYRVISNGNDKFTPQSAGLNMRQVQAEDFEVE